MAQAGPVFVKVLGFTDVERHALNTVFRLSESGPVHYMLWAEDAPMGASLALVDGQEYGAGLEAQLQPGQDTKFIWVGSNPPASAWRVFERPLHWPHVLQAMDGEFGDADDGPDFDLDLAGPDDVDGAAANDYQDTRPPAPEEQARRALIAAGTLDERLYLRARLALAGLFLADDAPTAAAAIELAQQQPYAVALVDLDMPDGQWLLLRGLRQAPAPIPHLICMKDGISLLDRFRARKFDLKALMARPLDPKWLRALLDNV